ncbi:hypothetical protein [Sphingomonas baiyangensis]|uniref:17 kDa surface antigen n=1 Tax=Sphingomonas baiyangensis TaxID=2572576 RepID=A0A4U1L5W8_9SPHN|nr:hypothetical protein [Sphingomonas baiyangensis]TKD51703.1 hypothetical protein FBR43_13765 [Sphingomonas baiyangensis]
MNILTKATIGVVAGATALTAAAPAEAQYRRYHRDRGGDVVAGAIIGGVAGLALGSALAQPRRGWYDPRWDGGYYGPPVYRGGWNRGWDRGFNNRRWNRRAYRAQCVRRVFDPYTGRRVRVRYC